MISTLAGSFPPSLICFQFQLPFYPVSAAKPSSQPLSFPIHPACTVLVQCVLPRSHLPHIHHRITMLKKRKSADPLPSPASQVSWHKKVKMSSFPGQKSVADTMTTMLNSVVGGLTATLPSRPNTNGSKMGGARQPRSEPAGSVCCALLRSTD